ncbi:GTPase [Aestuariispira insulae]|uniref:Flagellar biosynthesis protein FlhF n=1 Tax=Aestuariispira insulae TaxID=1461337 RepID=A0A3D9HSI6_9PROT|nr:GTPase [Aestuariispira insulae]RED52419.1 flagellar biosynthesis protein FlhF [Aestuariispira insulae]
MRLKTFHADSLAEALAQVREQLGPDAIIVATQEEEGTDGARVTAAIEQVETPMDFSAETTSPETMDRLIAVLERQGLNQEFTDAIVNAASEGPDDSPENCLMRALEATNHFTNLETGKGAKPKLLIGPPGTGKTVTCAKLAAREALNGRKAVVIAADPVRLTAAEQLAAYAERLGVPMFEAPNGRALADALSRCHDDETVFIDSPGTNPYNLEELAYLVELCEATDIEPVLVLNAGRDADDTADLAKAFRPVGAKHLICTGLDIAHRFGALLVAANAAGLAFCDYSATPNIANGLDRLSAKTLANKLLPSGGKTRDPLFPAETATKEAKTHG